MCVCVWGGGGGGLHKERPAAPRASHRVVGARVLVEGGGQREAGAQRRVLRHRDLEDGLREGGRVVVDVRDVHVHRDDVEEGAQVHLHHGAHLQQRQRYGHRSRSQVRIRGRGHISWSWDGVISSWPQVRVKGQDHNGSHRQCHRKECLLMKPLGRMARI